MTQAVSAEVLSFCPQTYAMAMQWLCNDLTAFVVPTNLAAAFVYLVGDSWICQSSLGSATRRA
jgi:hypothetical protein